MDKIILLKRTAIQSVALMIAVITLSYAFRQYHGVTISARDIHSAEAASISNKDNKTLEPDTAAVDDIDRMGLQTTGEEQSQVLKSSGWPENFSALDSEIMGQLGNKLLVIKKPAADGLTMTLEDLYLTKSVLIKFGSTQTSRMDSLSIGRINEGDIFTGEPNFKELEDIITNPDDGTVQTVITKDYGRDIVHGISFTYSETPGLYNTELLLELDNVYVHIVMEDDQYYYIGLKKPADVYDRIVVLDAGHGGKDAGALSKDETVYEKNVNLKILLELKELLDKENIKVYYTRLADDKVFLKPRVGLANAVDCDFFISIHCNANGSTRASGTEIYYVDTEFKRVKAETLAKIINEELGNTMPLTNRGLVERKKEDIYILNHAVVPAILIETGYMTNQKDLQYLIKEGNQKAIARAIYTGILRAYDELYPAK